MGHKWEQYLENVVALEEHLSAERAKLHFLSGSAHLQLLSQMTHLGFELSASKWEITKCESSHLQAIPFMDLIFPFIRRLKKIFVTSHKIGVHLVLFQFSPQVPRLLLQTNLWTTPKVAPQTKTKIENLTCSSKAATLSPSPCCFSSFSLAAASFLRKEFFSSSMCEHNNQI